MKSHLRLNSISQASSGGNPQGKLVAFAYDIDWESFHVDSATWIFPEISPISLRAPWIAAPFAVPVTEDHFRPTRMSIAWGTFSAARQRRAFRFAPAPCLSFQGLCAMSMTN
jgi:hypothetical protein